MDGRTTVKRNNNVEVRIGLMAPECFDIEVCGCKNVLIMQFILRSVLSAFSQPLTINEVCSRTPSTVDVVSYTMTCTTPLPGVYATFQKKSADFMDFATITFTYLT